MASNRIGRINDEIQKELASLLRTVKDPRVSETMLTITHVDTTSDLRYARVYVSALNCPDEKGLMKGLKSRPRLPAPRPGDEDRPALYLGAAVHSSTSPSPTARTSSTCSAMSSPRTPPTPTSSSGREVRRRMNVTETAALLRSRDRVLLLTHVRPDGDTIGSAARALPRAARHRQGGLPPAEPRRSP